MAQLWACSFFLELLKNTTFGWIKILVILSTLRVFLLKSIPSCDSGFNVGLSVAHNKLYESFAVVSVFWLLLLL